MTSIMLRRRAPRLARLATVVMVLTGVAAAPAGAAEPRPANAVMPGPLADDGYVSRRSGSSPELIKFVQRRVSRSGIHVRVDGVFGTDTETAVRRFQAARRLLVDGIVGRQTMTALRRPGDRPVGATQRPEDALDAGQARLESRRPSPRRARASATRRDRDHDRLPDRWEARHGLSTRKKSAGEDQDRDGLHNLAELRSRTRPRNADSDNDRLVDADEDPDRDRVDNRSEVRARTHPRRRDSDRDGRPDGREDRDRDRLANAAEDRSGNDPADSDSDGDGVRDGDENAGTVLSFRNGSLAIARFNGRPLSARVSEDTGLDCVGEDEAHRPTAAGDRADEADDDRADDDVADEAPAPPGGGDDGEDPCMRALVPGAGIRAAELDDEADTAGWSEVEVVR